MGRKLSSLFIWTAISLLVLFWLPVLGLVRLTDRNPVRYRTGRVFRTLGFLISKVNPNWKVSVEGSDGIDDRHPYVMVSNHLSNADIPVISNLPWEMKWVAKKELFSLPVVGWMMKLSGDIPVDRSAHGKKVGVFKRCKYYLDRNTSVMFFPEGTRSRSGRLNRFARGAFDLAIREQVPVLPIVLDGTQGCLPKQTWVFEEDVCVRLKVLEPIQTEGLSKEDTGLLVERVRTSIVNQLADWRGVPAEEVDGYSAASDQ